VEADGTRARESRHLLGASNLPKTAGRSRSRRAHPKSVAATNAPTAAAKAN